MTDDDLLRYSRHLLLDDIGIEGQDRWRSAHALIVGAGGLGSPAAMYLASAGVGRLTVVDDDTVDLTNLQRQIAHTTASIGQPKAESLRERLQALNPGVTVDIAVRRADADWLATVLPTVDVVLDCCDNFKTRQLVNQACVRHGKPLVAGAAIGFDGQLSVFDSRQPESPCYACLFPPDAPVHEASCATMGVFAPLVGIIGSLQAAEALKLLGALGTPLTGRLQMLDARRMEWTDIRMARQAKCPVCGEPA